MYPFGSSGPSESCSEAEGQSTGVRQVTFVAIAWDDDDGRFEGLSERLIGERRS
jgi:hypothetical protein